MLLIISENNLKKNGKDYTLTFLNVLSPFRKYNTISSTTAITAHTVGAPINETVTIEIPGSSSFAGVCTFSLDNGLTGVIT